MLCAVFDAKFNPYGHISVRLTTLLTIAWIKALQETHIEENGNQLAIRSNAEGVCGKVFQAVGMAMPPTIREI